MARYSEDDFRRGGYPVWTRGRWMQMSEHERVHKEFLQSAITSAGSEHVQPYNYDL